MVARLKLKGIDGGSHKRSRMWLNSRIREEPYLSGNPCIGAAWLSSVRVVRCRVKSLNERNPCLQLPASNVGDSEETAGVKPGEGGDDVKSSWPLCLELHTSYNALYRAMLTRESKPHKVVPSPDCRLKFASMKPESLVIADQHATVQCV